MTFGRIEFVSKCHVVSMSKCQLLDWLEGFAQVIIVVGLSPALSCIGIVISCVFCARILVVGGVVAFCGAGDPHCNNELLIMIAPSSTALGRSMLQMVFE